MILPFMARARTVGLSIALATTGLGAIATVPASANTQKTWNITVGGENFASFASLNRFYVSDITVHPGDLVNFNWAGFHTVTFNPPAGKDVLDYVFPPGLTGSNSLDTPTTFVNGTPGGGGGGPGSPPPPPFTLTIGADLPNGTYHFQCMLHQYMHGSIRVTRGALPRTDAENQTRAQAQMAADIARSVRLNAALLRRDSEDGALVGAGDHTIDFINYYPAEVRVQAGNSVTFKLADFGDPHSVTFGYANAPLSPPGEIFASTPSPATYSGGDLNSGYLMSRSMFKYWNLAGKLPGFTRRSEYTITFTTPGTYGFYCTIHGGILPDGTVVGMSGHVTVVAPEDDNANRGDRAAN